MNVEIITSFNEYYYDLIGKDSLESFLNYWPKDFSITCYVEEFSLEHNDRVKQISFDHLDAEYIRFQHTKGIGGQERKFSKKAFSFIHAMYNSNADRIIWLDADVLTCQAVPKDLILSLLPDNVLSTHMGVSYDTMKDGTPGRWFVPETGFFAVNTRHEKFNDFRKEYRRRYVEHDRSDLRRFYDNDVYGWVFESLNCEGLDLCKNFTKPYKTPLKHTVLGPYLAHYKAKHSKADYSSEQ